MNNDTTKKLELPTKAGVATWLKTWDEDEKNSHVVSSMQVLFEKIPLNNDFDEIYAKIAALNDLYSTNIRKLYDVAKHIYSIKNLDERLRAGDLDVVNEIARVPVVDKYGDEKVYNYYSFATKFCMFSNPEVYSIYDSYVEKVLVELNKLDHFFEPRELNFRDYRDFDTILNLFRKKYADALDGISRLDMDRYLWLLGKRTFPKTYYNKKKKVNNE